MAHAGRVAGLSHLEGNEPPIVAHHGVRAFVAGVIAEKSQAGVFAAAVKLEPPEVDVTRAEIIGNCARE